MPAAAQSSASAREVCLKPERRPYCHTILLTTAGAHVFLGSERDFIDNRVKPVVSARGIVDWGVLVNVSDRSSIGASWLLSLDEDEFITGPTLRYRRWISDSTSIDLGLGTSVANSEQAHAVAFALIKWNISRNVGLAVRPEWRKRTEYDCLMQPPYGCTPSPRKYFAMSAGFEFSGGPGLALSGVAAATFVALLAIYASISD